MWRICWAGMAAVRCWTATAQRTWSATSALRPKIAGGDPAEFIRKLARDFATHGPSIAIAGGSAGAHSNGLFNVEAATFLNWLVGSVGAEGGVVLNPSGPWGSVPDSASAASLDDFDRLAEQIRSGETRMLMVHNVDPVYGLPVSLKLRDAISSAQDLYVVSFSPFVDETTGLADLLLPDRVYLEDWGDDIPDPAPGYQVAGISAASRQPALGPGPPQFPGRPAGRSRWAGRWRAVALAQLQGDAGG